MGNLLKCCCCQTKEDIISELPDEILLHILSYLPAKDILKTFALSTRWKSLRYSILYFDFHAYYCDPTVSLDRAGELNRGLGFSDCISLGSFHDMVQALPDNSIIAKFCFRCPLLPNNESTLQSLLCHAARHKIEDMEFDFDYFDDDPYEPLMSLPPSLLNSDSLTSLKLTMATDVMFESPPNSIWLPRLKTLHIEWFEDWEQLILSGSCPVLEELILRCRGLNDDIFNDDYIDISIVSAAIKRLTIECSFMSEDSHTSLKVDCSNIQSLNISNWSGCGDIQVCDLYSLAEADIDIDCTPYYKSPLFWKSPDFWKPRNITSPPVLELLGSIRHVKSLKLSSSTVKVC
ncbi:hypothetical protein COLO4_28966 [Corchorus olitorius]|uniref:F-box domain-containing protein n=1 Tax=Corchorus olitorius TaxID=93759 RepID=A0A1R3HH98_9ROSI|nr:hypothetical protein COLO4_28966 [Corchorus olitorius]